MKTIIFLFLVILTSCKKDYLEERRDRFAGNRLNATIFMSSGDSIQVSIEGDEVHIGCGSFGSGGYVYGVSKGWASISVGPFFGCATRAGAYELQSQYIPDTRITNGPVYESDLISRPGRITYTMVSGNFYEGYFNDVCWDFSNNDSVIIKGTFKGHSEQ